MTLHWKGIAVTAAFMPLLWPLSAQADWAQSADPLVVRTIPSNSEVQLQNPPTFRWARYPGGAAGYEIQIRPEGGSPFGTTVERNWYLPAKSLAPGNYSWRVRPSGSNDWSTPRTFSITGKSTTFEVPDNAALRARILARARPRSLQPSFTPYAAWSASKKKDLDPYLSRLVNVVKLQTGALPDLDDARWPLVIAAPLTAAMAAQQREVANRIDEASRAVWLTADGAAATMKAGTIAIECSTVSYDHAL